MSLSAHIVKALLRLIGKLPLNCLYRSGHFFAFLAEKLVRYRVSDVTVNLSRSFPSLKYEEIKGLTHRFYRHFGDVIAETVWFGACRTAKRLRKQNICEVVNPEVLDHLYANSPSVMVLYSHYGNWELIGGITSYNTSDKAFLATEDDFCVVYKRLSSRMWDWIMKDNRCAPLANRDKFDGYIESGEIMRYVVNHRDSRKIYNFITDQSPYFNSAGNADITFMHQPTRTMTGAAAIARKFGFSVAYMSMRPDRRGHYLLEYTTICENASEMSVEDIMGKYYELLEKDINALPFNYLWSHRRWKIRMEND